MRSEYRVALMSCDFNICEIFVELLKVKSEKNVELRVEFNKFEIKKRRPIRHLNVTTSNLLF